VDVPHLDCLLVAAPITVEGLDHLILKSKQLDGIADDARAREVGLRHSSCEAGEQSGAIRCGASGAKGGDQGSVLGFWLKLPRMPGNLGD
jgi:hypothetical protein